MAPGGRSLTEFAAGRPGRSRKGACCRLVPPELMAQIAEERAKGEPLSYGFLADWLYEEHGIKITDGALRNHFTADHDGA